MDEFLKALAALIFLIVSHWVKDMIDTRRRKREEVARKLAQQKEKQTHTMTFTGIIHEKVKNAENELMKIYRPHRMFVFHFYNGDTTALKLPIMKVSARHEIVLHPGVKYLTEHFQGTPVPERFYEGILEAFDKGHYIYDYSLCSKNPPLKDFFDTWDVCSMLFISIRTSDFEPGGILVMQWPGEKIPVDARDILKIKAEKIQIEKIYAGKDLEKISG